MIGRASLPSVVAAHFVDAVWVDLDYSKYMGLETRTLACMILIAWEAAACGATEPVRPPPSSASAPSSSSSSTATSAVTSKPQPAGSSAAPAPSAVDPSPKATTELNGRVFQLASAQGYEPVESVKVQLAFRDGGVMFSAGCNMCGGAYDICDSKLCVKSLRCTLKGCLAPLEQQDDWLAAFLRAAPAITASENGVTLRGEHATLEFLTRELADPDRPLTGSVWAVTEFLDELGRWSFALQSDPTIEFHDDGRFQFQTGCGSGAGFYLVTGARLMLSEVKYDKRLCPSNEDARATNYVLGVLKDGSIGFAIRAERLRLVRGELELEGKTQ